MAKVIMIRNTFGGCKYLQKALKYIRDERAIAGGAFGVDTYDPEVAFYQMMCTKRFFNKTGGNPLIHIIVSYSKEVQSYETATRYGWFIANYYADRFQSVFCTHGFDNGNWYHSHIIINSVSYINGAMFDSSFKEMKKLRDYVAKITGEKCQFFFDNKNKAQ